MNRTPSHVTCLANVALRKIDEELERHRIGTGAVSNITELQRIKQIITDMKEELQRGSMPVKEERKHCGYGRMIVDSWPLPDPNGLGEALCAVENAYLDL